MPKTKRVLFLSYNGLLEPILPSQAIPYLEELAKRGFEFILLTYEKKRDIERFGKEKLDKKRLELKGRGIEWRYLLYHKNPPVLSTVFDLLTGALYVLRIMMNNKIDIMHVRGITPGIIIILISKILKAKILFDMRGLLAEEYVGGGLWKGDSVQFKIVKNLEERLLKISDAVTVLTNKHLGLNKGLKCIKGREIVMDVIPCCVDTGRFCYDPCASRDIRKKLNLENKTVLMYPGKIGTFYLMKEMLDFYKEMLKQVDNAIFIVLTNDNTDDILNYVRKSGIGEERIKIVKGVDFTAMPLYVNMADIGIFFINPYKKIGASPIKMGEFLSSGVPVIINPGIGDTEELVLNNRVGIVVRHFNEPHYAAAIHELLKLREDGNSLKRRCRETAQKYLSLENGVEKYYKIYKALV